MAWAMEYVRVVPGESITARSWPRPRSQAPAEVQWSYALVGPLPGGEAGGLRRHGGPGPGGSTGFSPGGRTPSACLPIPSWSSRSPTSSGSTCPRPPMRLCCAWTGSPRSRPRTAPSRCRPCSPPDRAPLLRLHPSLHLRPLHRLGDLHRQTHRGAEAPLPQHRVSGLPQADRTHLSRHDGRSERTGQAALGHGQLRRSQA